MLRKNFTNRRAQRREDATARAEERAKRSAADQLARLDANARVATRERARLGASSAS